MKKTFLLISAAICSFSAIAQEEEMQKWDAKIDALMTRNAKSMTTLATSSAELQEKVMINTDDVAAVAQRIENAGYSTTILTETMLTADIPVSFIPTVAAMDEVVFISGSNQMKIFTDKAVKLIGADSVHNGTKLETPYTGKNVIVGIIDQGFEFGHVAFNDSDRKSRVHSYWDRKAYKSTPTTTLPKGGENDNTRGHATHVTSIAAGSKVSDANSTGIAPEATIIMVSSLLEDNEVAEDVKYIYDTAKELGMPCVINMSFGGQIGPHDGTSNYSKTLNSYIDKGAAIVIATGNDANSICHTAHTFTEDNEVRYVFFNNTETTNYIDIWEQTANARKHLIVEPCYYSQTKSTVTVGKSNFPSGLDIKDAVYSSNRKQNINIYNSVDQMRKNCGEDALFGVKITGKKGASFHLWTMVGEIYRPLSFNTAGITANMVLSGDNRYTVCDNACTKKSIAVGSYNSGTYRWTPLKGGGYLKLPSFSEAGAISDFSNIGPTLLEGIVKPTVVAPGAMIRAAYNQHSKSFNGNVEQDDYTTDKITVKVPHPAIPTLTTNEYYYYGLMQGTSMSTPVVTGTIALWLEANPNLTHEQLIQIFKETSNQDAYTKQDGQDYWGYGKLNAYKGLVKALELKNASGIEEVVNSETPVSILMENNEWRLLFNNNETFANIRICDLNGRLVEQRVLNQVKCGQEEVVSMTGLPTGIYLISIETTKTQTTRKAVVK
jgi:subtilisin family serine protease